MGKILNYIEAVNKLDNKQINRMTIIFGEEKYLIDFFIEILKEEYLSSGFEDFNYDKIVFSNPDIAKLKEACETLPFGGGKRIVEIRGLDLSKEGISKDKEFYDELLDYSKTLDDNIVLLIISESGKFFKGSFYKKSINESNIIDMARLNHRELLGFISKRFALNQINIGKDIINYIIDKTGYLNRDFNKNLYNVQNEIDKLISSLGSRKRIKKEDIDSLMTNEIDKNIFILTDSICTGNLNMAINSFININSGKDDNYMSFYMIIRLIRNLLNIKILRMKGFNSQEILNITKLSKFEYGKLLNFEKRFTYDELRKMHKELYDAEVNLKSSVGNFEDNMIYLISKLCIIK